MIKFIDLNYKQFKTTDIARCLTTRYIAAPTNHTCENSGVLIGGGENMEVRAVLTPDCEEKRQNGRRMKDEGEPMFTLTAQDRHGVAIIDDQGRTNKKLTPSDICPTLRAQSHGNEPKVIDVYNKRELEGGIVGTLTASGNTSIGHCGTFLVAEHNDAKIYTGGSSPKHNNRVIVGGLPIREATNKGYSVAYPGDGVNIGMPSSTTRRGRVNHGLANTLTTTSEMGVVDHAIRIRRLTPRECWRLQGFPDEYFDKAKAAGISDSQLYKMAGNGVTVNVARAIGERLKEVEEHGTSREAHQGC